MAQRREDYDYSFKIILVGDTKVGKTSFLLRYTKNITPKKPPPTIGVAYTTKSVLLQDGEGIVKAQIWDTAGSDKYKSIATAHYRKAVGALLFYDLTNYESFNNMKGWLKEIQDNSEEGIVTMVIGNKYDLVQENPNERKVRQQEVQAFAAENKLLYEETSAKNGHNVKESFEKLIQKVYEQVVKQGTLQHDNEQENIHLNPNPPIQQQDGCCGMCKPKN